MWDDFVGMINRAMQMEDEDFDLADYIVVSNNEDSDGFELGNSLKELASELAEAYIDEFKDDEDPKECVSEVINHVLRPMVDKFLDAMWETVEKEL